MLDFNTNGLFARLIKVGVIDMPKIINDFIIDGETIIGAYRCTSNSVVFTNKRIIIINTQGITVVNAKGVVGKKQDYTSIPYNIIHTFSLETSGFTDQEAKLEIYINGIGNMKFHFTQDTDTKEICKAIAQCTIT